MPFINDDNSDAQAHQNQHDVTSTEPDEFHQLVQTVSNTLGPASGIGSTDIHVAHLIDLMKEYTSNEQGWQRYALSDPSRHYTRNLVDEGNGRYNLLILVWKPGKGSPIHDHANAHCIMKILKGQLREAVYKIPDEHPSQTIPSSNTQPHNADITTTTTTTTPQHQTHSAPSAKPPTPPTKSPTSPT